jgi:two-component system, chemotaxis family, sensor kinase CheA
VKAALSLQGRAAPALAARLEKQLAPIVVDGDDVALPPGQFGDFFRSLVHVFRNAVDHGIEAPEERLNSGKPADGVIRCDVRAGGDFVEIAISDDGRGIDRRALEAKLATGGVALEPSQTLEDLVFREGLSSREEASDVSGRGVGLAAVKHELDRLGGTATVTSEVGAGACFRFRLPTLSRAPLQDMAA